MGTDRQTDRQTPHDMSSLLTMEARVAKVFGTLRDQLFEKKGIRGLTALKQNFLKSDIGGGMMLDKDELCEVIHYSGLFLSKQDVSLLFKFLDTSGDKHISYEEFLNGLAPHISKNKRRYAVVREAFRRADRAGRGALDFKTSGDATMRKGTRM